MLCGCSNPVAFPEEQTADPSGFLSLVNSWVGSQNLAKGNREQKKQKQNQWSMQSTEIDKGLQ
jgi:hypothetical protein